jgi:hypothetical protein
MLSDLWDRRRAEPKVGHELAGYLRGIAADLNGIDRLLRQRQRSARMRVVGSRAVAKHLALW